MYRGDEQTLSGPPGLEISDLFSRFRACRRSTPRYLLIALSRVGGLKAVQSPGLSSGGVPFRTIGVMSFILAAALLLSAAGDVLIMRYGMPRGGPRLARHL